MQSELPVKTRIEGYDLARALAIWGMITVLGLVDDQPLILAVSSAAAFFAMIVLISLAVHARGKRGPLE